MKTYDQLLKEFGARICTLNTGAPGLRAGIHCTVKDVAGDDPVMDFIASDETVDRYNECIKQNGWELDNFLANPVVPDCHDYSSVGKILGKDILPKDKQVQDGKLCTRIMFCLDNPMGALAYKMAKAGFLKSQSVGFIPLEWTNGNDKDSPDRTYTKCELLEKSLVVVPANPGATIGNQIRSVLNVSERRDLADFLKQFCSEQTPAPGGASERGVHDAQLLNLARTLRGTMSGK
ncbi:HK97 family phage prohead protease [Silvimonas sp.]|uniref:HK97 family phage prohead protease n=1 Tax=Silvimonas sp. TaxID=2650811 RepID=UPI0028488DC1|nr:HK97 family phage prohead protease [Silvimonas sp.]MDR3427848.1 HK97 family phage prohead protease [Silvimonas sp.]